MRDGFGPDDDDVRPAKEGKWGIITRADREAAEPAPIRIVIVYASLPFAPLSSAPFHYSDVNKPPARRFIDWLRDVG